MNSTGRRSHPEWFRRFVEETNRAGKIGATGAYHKMDFGEGLIMDGQYDMSLTGKKVLDIGTASGFFALECACRGGDVTAIDIHDGYVFRKICDGLGLEATYVQKDMFDLDETFGEFDLVLCFSVLLHVRDILGAMQRMRAVCREQAIVATGLLVSQPLVNSMRRLISRMIVQDLHHFSERAICEFVGLENVDRWGWTYWMTSMTALKRMLLAAGFSRVEEISRFILRSEPGKGGFATPHGVVRANV